MGQLTAHFPEIVVLMALFVLLAKLVSKILEDILG